VRFINWIKKKFGKFVLECIALAQPAEPEAEEVQEEPEQEAVSETAVQTSESDDKDKERMNIIAEYVGWGEEYYGEQRENN